MDRQANINRFEAEMKKVTREGADRLMAFIRKSDMYAAPASTRFHLSVTGGLLQHSLNVLDALRTNLTKNDDGTYSYEVAGCPVARVTEENVIIMALLHDICKTYFYTTEIRNRKVNGKWESRRFPLGSFSRQRGLGRTVPGYGHRYGRGPGRAGS